jgi:hypothetical protein
LLEGTEGKEVEGRGTNIIAYFLFLPSFLPPFLPSFITVRILGSPTEVSGQKRWKLL